MNLVERVLLDHFDDLGLSSVGLDRRLQTVLLTPRFVTSRHVVALVLAVGDPTPRAVVKIPRRPGDDDGVRTEARTLARLAELQPDGRCGAPRLLGTAEVEGRTVLVQSAVTGSPLDRARVLRDGHAAVAMGADFIRGLPVVRPADENPDWYDHAVRAPIARMQDLVGDEGDLGELCARTHDVLEPLRTRALPAVFEHGDLSFPNLFVADDDRTLIVIDWERASESGLPGHDLAFFLQFVSQCLHGFATPAQQTTAFDRAFVGPDAWGRPALDRHLSERGIDPELAGLLVVACWARSAATLASRLGLDARAANGRRGALAAAVLGERDVVLWRHAVALAETGAPLGLHPATRAAPEDTSVR